MSPDIIVLCEIKTLSTSAIRKFFKKLKYACLIQRESGILVAAKKKLSCVNVTTTSHPNVLSARVLYKGMYFRFIAAYGPQETCSIDERTEFFEDVSIEVDNAFLLNDNPIVIGDLNAKIEYKTDVIVPTSSNGKLLAEVLEENALNVINFHPKCQGKWTRSITKKGILEESVIDYILVNDQILPLVQNITIDEERFFTPFSLSLQGKQTSTDHNAIYTELSWSAIECPTEKHRKKEQYAGWNMTEEGLIDFFTKTGTTPGPDGSSYEDLERYISNTLSDCFKKRRPAKNNSNEKVQSKHLLKLINNIKPMLKMGRIQRETAREYIDIIKQNEVQLVQGKRYARIRSTLDALQNEKGEISIDEFWKLKKCVSSKTEEKTSIMTSNGIIFQATFPPTASCQSRTCMGSFRGNIL